MKNDSMSQNRQDQKGSKIRSVRSNVGISISKAQQSLEQEKLDFPRDRTTNNTPIRHPWSYLTSFCMRQGGHGHTWFFSKF